MAHTEIQIFWGKRTFSENVYSLRCKTVFKSKKEIKSLRCLEVQDKKKNNLLQTSSFSLNYTHMTDHVCGRRYQKHSSSNQAFRKVYSVKIKNVLKNVSIRTVQVSNIFYYSWKIQFLDVYILYKDNPLITDIKSD